jgi:hypothetical protein
MNFEDVKKVVKMSVFFERYTKIRYNSTTRFKMSGKDRHGKPYDFNEEEMAQIKQSVRKLIKDLKRFVDS